MCISLLDQLVTCTDRNMCCVSSPPRRRPFEKTRRFVKCLSVLGARRSLLLLFLVNKFGRRNVSNNAHAASRFSGSTGSVPSETRLSFRFRLVPCWLGRTLLADEHVYRAGSWRHAMLIFPRVFLLYALAIDLSRLYLRI